jgi:predicted O-methyltransferase YrrM
MKAVPFEEAWRCACDCNVMIGPNEGRRLYELARQAPENVVEIGSLHGGSAILLALAGVRRLTLIDPVPQPLMLRSLAKFNLLQEVHLLNFPDFEIWPIWSSEISLMFLDHEHKYLPVRNSLAGWRRHLEAGARIAIHDYVYEHEVKVGVDEHAPELKVMESIDNLAIAVWLS